MENAFVIGNGQTRLELDLENLRGNGKTYGCNYLYEDFVPDVLVAVDTGIAQHIENLGYSKTNTFYTRNPSPSGHKIDKNFGFSSGQVALTLACDDNSRYVYFIGFDLMGHGKIKQKRESTRKFNNVYADRPFYKKSTDVETYYGNWITQVRDIMNEYKDRRFIRVNPHLKYSPPEWEDCQNYETLSLKHFVERINT